jgi:hypothetical protein
LRFKLLVLKRGLSLIDASMTAFEAVVQPELMALAMALPVAGFLAP